MRSNAIVLVLWRQNRERNQRVRQPREQSAIVHESILANRAALNSGDNLQQLLALTARLDTEVMWRLQPNQAVSADATGSPAASPTVEVGFADIDAPLKNRPVLNADARRQHLTDQRTIAADVHAFAGRQLPLHIT
jgi:hypothetical protein